MRKSQLENDPILGHGWEMTWLRPSDDRVYKKQSKKIASKRLAGHRIDWPSTPVTEDVGRSLAVGRGVVSRC